MVELAFGYFNFQCAMEMFIFEVTRSWDTYVMMCDIGKWHSAMQRDICVIQKLKIHETWFGRRQFDIIRISGVDVLLRRSAAAAA